MKTVKSVIKFLVVAAIVAGMCVPAYAFPPPQPIPGQYIVQFKVDKLPPAEKSNIAAESRDQKAQGALLKRQGVLSKINSFNAKNKIKESAVIHRFSHVMAGYSAKLSPNEVVLLRKNADVAGVFQDFTISLGPIQAKVASAASVKAQSQPETCAIQKAGGHVDGSTKNTWIWILDTGIDQTHPDLNVQTNPTHAKSFVPGQSAVVDGKGHGTHCAGIAAAKNNAFGVVGVSAGAKVVPVKVLDNTGNGQWSWLIAGLDHVSHYDIPGDVVSMSLGGYPVNNCANASPSLNNVIYNLANAGTYVVMAAGNNGQCNGAASCLPGCINHANVFTVGALNCNMTRAGYSNYGPNLVDWVAVGTDVYSTYPVSKGSYATMSGTSMATPVVAGIIHARHGAPVSGGNVNVAGCGVYKSAHR